MIFKKCRNCGTIILSGVSHGDHIYCSKKCEYEMEDDVGFCSECLRETTSENAGNLSLTNGIFGTSLETASPSQKCSVCGSEIKEVVYCFIFLKYGRGQYRVLDMGTDGGNQIFLSRRLVGDVPRGFLPGESLKTLLIFVAVILFMIFGPCSRH